jgi:hypothetical protein
MAEICPHTLHTRPECGLLNAESQQIRNGAHLIKAPSMIFRCKILLMAYLLPLQSVILGRE